MVQLRLEGVSELSLSEGDGRPTDTNPERHYD